MAHIEHGIGDRFGYWTVVGEAVVRNTKVYFPCRCDCGTERLVNGCDLRSGKSKSCRCQIGVATVKRCTKHGDAGQTRLYEIWKAMKSRCCNTRHRAYARYGGRGITVCQEWRRNFTAFRDWALSHGYADNLSIDRIDNDGHGHEMPGVLSVTAPCGTGLVMDGTLKPV
jgi:hypothetical protein